MRAMLTAVMGVGLMMMLNIPATAAEDMKSDRPGGAMVEASSISATIEAIDYKTRSVTLKGPKGGLVAFIAGDEVKRFNELKKGDQVTFDYAEGVAIDVQKATEAPKMIETQSLTRSKASERPGGTLETVGFLTARVDAIDYKTRVVKLALPEGQSLKITVGDQVKRLNEVKKGDEVVVQYMQKLSIKVTSPKAK
jgi:ribosomal 50S subunit-recycling heat shock protein